MFHPLGLHWTKFDYVVATTCTQTRPGNYMYVYVDISCSQPNDGKKHFF